MTSFAVSYDYRCPFAKNIHLHLVQALRVDQNLDVTFIPWTLSQGHRPEGAIDVWDDETKDPDHYSLYASISVRDEQPEKFLDAHEALFKARHEHGLRLVDLDEIDRVLAVVGVDTARVRADIASRRPAQILGASYRDMAAYEAFGVPTFVLDDKAVFVRYMTPPTDGPAASSAVIENILGLITNHSDLNEFKHTRLPR